MLNRRELIKSGVAGMAGAVGLAPGLASASVGPAAVGNRIVFGANRAAWTQFDTAMPVGIQRAVRIYYDYGQIPQHWPNRTGTAWITLSLRPSKNPNDLLDGSLDAPLKAVINSAPAHSQLTFYHENEPGNPMQYPAAINNATTARAILEYGHKLCAGSKVVFGVIICAPADQITAWMAPKLDFYAYDRYLVPRYLYPNGTLNVTKLYHQMNSDYDVFRHMSGLKWPQMGFPETNAPHDNNRQHWFTALAEWSAGHNCRRILTRWGGAQGLSGPWPPSDSVIDRLRYLSYKYRQ
jgi:hypothetical protein